MVQESKDSVDYATNGREFFFGNGSLVVSAGM